MLLGITVDLSHLWIFKWFPIVRAIGTNLPYFIVKRLDPVTRSGAELGWEMNKQVEEHMKAVNEGHKGKLKDVDHDLIFHRLLTVGHNEVKGEEPLSRHSIVSEVNKASFRSCTRSLTCSTEQVDDRGWL